MNSVIKDMRKKMMIAIKNDHKGVTLIELLVAMAVGMIVMAGIYGTYHGQEKAFVNQQLVVDMQQNVRAAMLLMTREIRMTGYDPAAADGIDNDGLNGIDDAAESSGATLLKAGKDWIQFSADLEGDGDVLDANEDITYQISGSDLVRIDAADGVEQIVAYDIEAVGFAYAYDEDTNGQLDTFDGTPNTPVIWAIRKNPSDTQLGNYLDTDENGVIDETDGVGGLGLPHQIDFDKIKAVRIWLLGRTRQPVRGYRDHRTYKVGWQNITTNDNYRRLLLTATVACRNKGI
jgi:prepilin-type N-terminal cleavage/methylation domain-containing protein